MSVNFMDKVIDYIENTSYEQISQKMRETSKLAIIDTLGVALAGFQEPSVQLVKKTFSGRYSDKGTASLWGSAESVSLEYAALINGTASHALDYDDVSPSILAHPSAPIVSAILPVAEYLEKTVDEVISAYVVGTSVMIKIGQVMGQRHYNLGWHATSTLGTVGGAAAVGKLMNLSNKDLANAISISASMASGLQKNFGTMTKPLHVGMAAQYAIQSALLAKEGFEGNRLIFEERGFFKAFSGNLPPEDIQMRLAEVNFYELHDFEINGLSVKKFPCCYLTHRFIDGILSIKKENNIGVKDIKEINISVPPKGLTALIHNRPDTGLQGKFSAEYTCLAALEDGNINLQTFTDQSVQRPLIQEALHLVKTEEYAGEITNSNEIENLPVYVSVETNNKKTFKKEVLHAPGSKGKPMTLEDHEEKWIDCLSYVKRMKESPEHPETYRKLFHQGYALQEGDLLNSWLFSVKDAFSKYN